MSTDAAAIGELFDLTFAAYDVRMRGGFDEPIYLPSGHRDLVDARIAEVRFSHDFAASALHEAAHWCIVGVERRSLVDYGYEYLAPPRAERAKVRFFDLEKRVQALEWVFCLAARLPFRPSLDDLTATSCDLARFAARIDGARGELLARGLPRRAALFANALAEGSAASAAGRAMRATAGGTSRAHG